MTIQNTHKTIGILVLCFAVVFSVLVLQGCTGMTGNTVSEQTADEVNLSTFNENAQEIQANVDSITTTLTEMEDAYQDMKESINTQISSLNTGALESDNPNMTGLNFAEDISELQEYQGDLNALDTELDVIEAEAEDIEEWVETVEDEELAQKVQTYLDLVTIYTDAQDDALNELSGFFESLQVDLNAFERGDFRKFDTQLYNAYQDSMDNVQTTMVALRAQIDTINR